ncbi:cell division protein ZapA [Marinimicrobium sp. ABcell2]|uniref:cell division protein ZapA n=1 Tax=Marinimicrobium sp. ABcell2 TaxID=3069751 RepID=UPI0027B198B5|nr:cell division protein ZapA [Marinimicrobium sp. ABcell2]MDQ2076142.1 cell division protein ZapA [Marinimicrobium sp. ABcell2]
MASETVIVQILDKDYQVSCPAEERSALIESAHLLDERMRTIKRSGSVIGLERIAVMAALNLSHELLQAKSAPTPTSSEPDPEELSRLHAKLDRTLERFEQI